MIKKKKKVLIFIQITFCVFFILDKERERKDENKIKIHESQSET